MNRKDITFNVIKIIEQISDIRMNERDFNLHFKELLIDSLTLYEIVFAIEEAFKLSISDEEAYILENMNDIVNIIESKIG